MRLSCQSWRRVQKMHRICEFLNLSCHNLRRCVGNFSSWPSELLAGCTSWAFQATTHRAACPFSWRLLAFRKRSIAKLSRSRAYIFLIPHISQSPHFSGVVGIRAIGAIFICSTQVNCEVHSSADGHQVLGAPDSCQIVGKILIQKL
jgi:hypothetical protein